MDIANIEILDEDKLKRKHGVYAYEVEEVLWGDTRFFFAEKGNVVGEDLYRALGQTEEGRYLVVFFIYKRNHIALVTSAREMTLKERKRHGKK
ncbi:hypothetical protein ANRL1_03056 [Anaerolineae bacterium]|nr:hypothetical protein ANRL1_03056 [Anaerolineae bacterium]